METYEGSKKLITAKELKPGDQTLFSARPGVAENALVVCTKAIDIKNGLREVAWGLEAGGTIFEGLYKADDEVVILA